jgi:predicted amidohydrolase
MVASGFAVSAPGNEPISRDSAFFRWKACDYSGMAGEHSGTDEGGALIADLRAAQSEPTRVVALLWTWLDRHLLELGSLREKLPAIRKLVVDEDQRYEGIDEALLAWISVAPLRNAAELLSRIDLTLGKPAEGLMTRSVGFQGEEVVVAWRRTDLVRRVGKYGQPPSASEHPSLTTLAPSLVVCPLVAGGLELIPRRLEGLEGELVRSSLENAIQGDRPAIEVHLDTLATAGLPTPWNLDTQLRLAALIEEMKEKEDEAVEAAEAAIEAARGSSRILVLPELVASDETLTAISGALSRLEGDGPALTIVGRFHRIGDGDDKIDPDLLGDSEPARYVNEAVVLGPFGNELWKHRKFSSAGAKVPTDDGEQYMVEDIRLGRSLTVVDTPLGTVAVPICLDTFAAHGRARLERSPANVLLVPSLSAKVERHSSSLRLLVAALWGLAFVCNRWLEWSEENSNWDAEKNRSFWVVPGSDESTSIRGDGSRPSFVFTL